MHNLDTQMYSHLKYFFDMCILYFILNSLYCILANHVLQNTVACASL